MITNDLFFKAKNIIHSFCSSFDITTDILTDEILFFAELERFFFELSICYVPYDNNATAYLATE